MTFHLYIIGAIQIVLALIHAGFPRKFKWRDECGTMSLINRQMMYVHTFFLALGLLLMGILCLTSANDLVATPLGKKISLGFGIFWLFRWIFQFFVYKSELWKGKTFETTVHILFALLWTYFSAIFFLIYFS